MSTHDLEHGSSSSPECIQVLRDCDTRYNVFFFFSSGIEYGWGIADTGKNSSFICEIPLSEVYKIGGEARDFGKS